MLTQGTDLQHHVVPAVRPLLLSSSVPAMPDDLVQFLHSLLSLTPLLQGVEDPADDAIAAAVTGQGHTPVLAKTQTFRLSRGNKQSTGEQRQLAGS